MTTLLERQPGIQHLPDASFRRKPESVQISGASLRVSKTSTQETKEFPWYKLPSTGFNIEGEINCLLRMYQDGIQGGKTSAGSLKIALSETRGNIIGYKFEYIMQRLLLPNPVTLHRVNNRLRLTNSLSFQPLEDITTEQERFGSVKRAVQQVEDHMSKEDGKEKIAIIQSPNGWSGFKSPDGKDVVYPDSQTYIFRKDANGKLGAFTVVTGMGFEENRHFLAKLGKDKDRVGIGSDQKEQIADVVENVILLSGKEAEIGFAGVVDKIRETRNELMGTGVARTIKHADGRVEHKDFSEIYQDLKNDRLIDSDKFADAAIAEFENYITSSLASQGLALQESKANSNPIPVESGIHQIDREEFEKRLALTVVNVSRAVRGKSALQYSEVFPQKAIPLRIQQISFVRELAYMKTLGGCNGGGLTTSSSRWSINSGLGLRLGISAETRASSEKKKCEDCGGSDFGSCGFCNTCFPE